MEGVAISEHILDWGLERNVRILSRLTVTAIFIVTFTSSVNDYSKERQFKALSDTREVPEVKVLRDGQKYAM